MPKTPIKPMDRRWKIVCPSYEGAVKHAVSIVNEAVSADTHYIPEVVFDLSDTNCNLIIVGTKDDAVIAPLLDEQPKKGGYIVKVCKNKFNEDRLMALIVGDSPVEAIYAAAEFADDYKALACRTDRVPYFDVFFTETNIPMPEYYVNTAPAVKRRGIWTWGALHL